MRLKKTLLIGPRNSGKTTLAHLIEGIEKTVRKQAHIVYGKKTIDTPSTYLESPWMRQHIISLQQHASVALFLFPLSNQRKSYPPGFTQVFRIPVYGVVTYTNDDCLNSESKQEMSKKLKEVGQFEGIIFINIDNKEKMEKELKKIERR